MLFNMINLRINHTILCLSMVVFFEVTTLSTEVTLEKAFDIVRSLEKETKILYWNSSVEQKFYGHNLKVTVQSKYVIEAFFDPSRKLYNVTYVISPPRNDTKRILGLTTQLAYDGKQYTFLDHNRKEGCITKDRSDCPSSHLFSGLYYAQEGLCLGLPNIMAYKTTSRNNDSKVDLLSTFFHGWKNTTNQYEIKDDGVLSIFAHIKLLDTTDCPVIVALDYNTMKGGIITSAVVKYKQLDENKTVQEKVLCNWTVETKQKTDGKWVPTKTSYQEFAAGRLFASFEANFESVEINPITRPDLFVISMPDGTYVDDYIEKLRYKVGDIFEEDQAIEAFMQTHGLTGDIPIKMRRGNTIRYILMGTGIILICIAIFQMIQKRRKE